jgi:hypothetical protein
MAVRFTTVGDYLTRTRANGVYGRASAADNTQDYTVYFKLTPYVKEVAADAYTTFFASLDSNSYSDGLWIGHADAVTANAYVETYSGTAITGGDTITLSTGVEVDFAYTRAGTAHKVYVNNVQVASWTGTAPGTLNETWVGGDAAGFQSHGGWTIRRLREWEGTALSAGQLATEAGSSTPVVTTNLLSDIPFATPDDYLDDSGNGNHLTEYRPALAGSPGTAFTSVGNVVPLTGDFTYFAWMRFDSTSGTFQGVLELLDDVSPAWAAVQRDSGGDIYAGYDTIAGSPASYGATDIPNDVWRPVAITQTGTTQRLYINGALIATATVDYTGATTLRQNIGHPTGAIGSRVAFARLWTAALSLAEIQAEARSITAVRTSNLFSDHPLTSDGSDISGNYRGFVVGGGTPTYVDGPAIPGSVQRLRGRAGLSANTTANWIDPCGPEGDFQFNDENVSKSPWAVDGTFSRLYVNITTAMPASQSVAFEVYKNGVATGLVVTIANPSTSGSDTTNSFTVVAGDQLSMRALGTANSSVGTVTWSLRFESVISAVHGYAFAYGSDHSNGAVSNGGGVNPFFASTGWTGSFHAGVVANAMTIDAFYLRLSTALTGANAWVWTIYKNLVAQDGTSGTPDTRVAMNSGTGTTGNALFSLSVAAGDRLHIRASLTAGSASTFYAGVGLRATAAVAGESTVNVRQGNFTNSTRYAGGYGTQASISSTEADHQWADFGGFRWRHLYAFPISNVGGAGMAFTVRKGGVDTALDGSYGSGDTVVLVDSGDVAVESGDLMTIRGIGGTGVASRMYVLAYTMMTGPLTVSVSEAVTVTESVQDSWIPPQRGVWETVTVTEGATAALTPLLISVYDAVTVVDVLTVVMGGYLGDTVTVADVVTALIPNAGLRPSEAVTVSDVVILRVSVLALHLFETVALTESPLNQNTSGIGPTPPPPPGETLEDFWVVGIL